MLTTISDVRLALRSFRLRPGLTLVVLVTLALGIGATTAIFSVVDAVLLRPLPYPEPDRVVRFLGTRDGRLPAGSRATVSYPDVVDIVEQSGLFETAAVYDEWRPVITGGGEPESLDAALVGIDFFAVLGIRPAAGRFFVPREDIDGYDRVVVLSHRFWQRRFGGDRGIVGRTVLLDGTPHTVVGVGPADFEDPALSGEPWQAPALWRPLGYGGAEAARLPSRSGRSFTAIGRLRPEVSLAAAQSAVRTLSDRLEAAYPDDNTGRGVVLMGLRDSLVQPVARSIPLLLAAVALLLAIAVANVINLLLGRALDRRRETAVRAALGAGRGRLMRQLLTECLVLAAAGGGLGALLARLLIDALVALGGGTLGSGIPRGGEIAVDGRVLAFAAGVTLLTGIVSALAPAWLGSRDLRSPIAGGRSTTSRSSRLRGSLVVAEIALSVVLLISAGLLLRSFTKLTAVDPGVDAAGVLTFHLTPPRRSYPETADVTALYHRLLAEIRALPGVEAAGLANIVPLSGSFDGNPVTADDRPLPPPGKVLSAQTRTVTPDVRRALGLTLLRGRWLDERDTAGAPQVAVISQSLADFFWPGLDPIGRRLTAHQVSCEVVGVVADVKHLALDEPAPPHLYVARAQAVASWQTRRMTVLVRTGGDAWSLLAPIRQAVWSLDPDLPISGAETVGGLVAATVARPRFRTVLLGSFAGLALALACVGVFGVLSYGVSERRREIAIRMALGAEERTVMGEVVRRGADWVAAGLALGLAASLAVRHLLEHLLFGISSADPVSWIGVPLVVLAVALAASAVPARRAARIDPMSLLRST